MSSLALMGAPFLCGFVSKWQLAAAAIDSGTPLALAGVGILLVSALLTAIYMLTMVIRAYFPTGANTVHEGVSDPDFRMLLPLFAFAAAMLVFGVYSEPFVEFFTSVANGLL